MRGQQLSKEAARRMWSELKEQYGRGGFLLFDRDGNSGDYWYSDLSSLEGDVNVDMADDILCECPKSASDLGTLDDFIQRTQRWLDQRPAGQVSTLNCPQCRSVDRVIRVSSAYGGGVASQTSDTGGVAWTLGESGLSRSILHGRTAGVSRSNLSGRLAPLSSPASGIPTTAVAGVVSVGIIVALALLHVRAWVLYAVVVAAWVIFVVVGVKREHYRETVVMPWYERYLHAWDNLYYCERCDVVFRVGGKKVARPEGMNDLLADQVGDISQY
jgi:hypothetical protein